MLHWMCLTLLGVTFTGCPNRVQAPTLPPSLQRASEQSRIRWFRRAFYNLVQEEQRQRDAGDRPRKLIRRYPQLARRSFLSNQQHLEARKKQQKLYGPLERYYLLMNDLIEESLGVIEKKPQKAQARRSQL